MRKFSKMAFGVLALLSLTACGSGSSSNEGSISTNSDGSVVFDNVSITFGDPITGSDGSAMRQLVKMFNEEYAGQINVTETFMSETEYYESLLLTIPMKRSYDVALVHSYKIASFANKGLLYPLQDVIDGTDIDIQRSDYIPAVYDSMFYDDTMYGLPLDIHTIVLYYNKDLLNQYGLSVPTNRSELIADASQMPNNSTGWGLPIATAWPSEYIYTTALYQNNGQEIDADGNPAYNTAAGAAAMKSVADLIHLYNLSPENVSTDSDLMLFNQGKAMFHINGDWMINSVVESGVNFGVTSLSNMFNEDGADYSAKVAARSHCFVLPEGRNNTVKQQAAVVFMKYMTEHAYIWAEGGGHVPASNIARETSEYQALPYQKYYGDVNDFQLNQISPHYYEAFSPVFSSVTTALSDPNYNVTELLDEAAAEGAQLVAEAKAS